MWDPSPHGAASRTKLTLGSPGMDKTKSSHASSAASALGVYISAPYDGGVALALLDILERSHFSELNLWLLMPL